MKYLSFNRVKAYKGAWCSAKLISCQLTIEANIEDQSRPFEAVEALVATAPEMLQCLQELSRFFSANQPVHPGALLKPDQDDETTIEEWVFQILAKAKVL